MAVYCHQCGTGLPPAARFCSNCGAALQFTQPMPGRPLVRPHAGRTIAGVCAGLAQANGWDVAVVRIVAVVGFFCSCGIVSVAYIAGWIGIPDEQVTYPGAYPPQV
jgi:phage shock protein PspC (stress-responsive transcriptional regulator)